MLHIFTDGCARGNPGSAAIAYIIEDSKGNILEQCSEHIGVTTNNVAEYRALIKALEEASTHCRFDIFCFCDSEIVVKQLNSVYRIKKRHLKELFLQVKNIEKMYRRVTYSYLPKTNPKIAKVDKLANKELDRLE